MNQLAKQYYAQFVSGFWSQRFAILALGVLSALYFGLLGVAWAVTGEFTRWGGHFLQAVGVDTATLGYLKLVKFAGSPLTRPDGVMVIAMFIGAFSSALLGRHVKVRVPSGRRALQALIGGIIAGFGTRMAMGCNLAALFTGIPQFSLHAWLFTLGTIGGTYLGVKISMQRWVKGKPRLSKVSPLETAGTAPYYRWQPALGMLLMGGFAYQMLSRSGGTYPANLLLASLFGFAFGFLIQKGQVCFTSAFRDLWLIGRPNVAKALVMGIAVQTLITAAFLAKGAVPNVIWWAGPNALLGGVMFGIGIVIAGGCETGWMYRSVEGQLQFWIVGLGNVIGATLLTLAWDPLVYPNLVEPFARIDMAKQWGMPAALLLTALLLTALYVWADWRQNVQRETVMMGRAVRER